MTLKLYNTLTRSLDPFQPLEEGRVRMYACGPTIYDFAHIGNFRAFVVYDLLHRYLEWSGYDVRFVMNVTDVDDKTIEGATRRGVKLEEYTRPFGEAFREDSATLGILPADASPRATLYIDAMVAFVQRLLERGLAYATDDGSAWFSIAAFPGYGKLSRVDLDQVRPGARVAMDEYAKEDVRDFAVWKAARPDDEKVGAAWDAPWGRGRPGWHLECSVMSVTELGETLDLHMGGEDLIFPHHEDEIAQSEGATGQPFVRTWIHVKHLLVEGRKMSKSAGNFIRLRDLLEEGHEAAAVRHQLLSAQYRRELNFTREGLEASSRAVQRLLDFEARLEALAAEGGGKPTSLAELADAALARFRAALDDDLNSADALAALFVLVGEVNAALDAATGPVRTADRAAVLDALRSIDRVLGLIGTARSARSVDGDTERWIEDRIEERAAARRSRDFERADAIRDELAGRGIVLEDSAGGTRWKLVRADPTTLEAPLG